VHDIVEAFEAAKSAYDAGDNPVSLLRKTAALAVKRLARHASVVPLTGQGPKCYSAFATGRSSLSRPFLTADYVKTARAFERDWNAVFGLADADAHRFTAAGADVNKVLYTAITAFACCYDLWKASSRKTPGTFFEILIGSVMGTLLGDYARGKSIPIPNEIDAVETDIVFQHAEQQEGLVVATKITTRERIVQPFAHQRILDGVFGKERYRSLLLCVSELQRDGDARFKEICVPGTVRLFQKHLASLSHIVYLDPPSRYLQQDITGVVPVVSMGDFLTKGLPTVLTS
jgi:hypothetical protein